MDQSCMKKYQLTSDDAQRLFELAQLLREFNEKYNRTHPVRMINMKGKIYKFIFRISRAKIPQPKVCIAMLEKKLINYL
jgi:predicted Mrr-cat superfamily restriction endonuclease